MSLIKDMIKEYNDKATELINQGKGLNKVSETNWYEYIGSLDNISEELKELHETKFKLEDGKEDTLFISVNPSELTIPEMISNRDAIDAHLVAGFNKVKPVGIGNITNFINNLKNTDALINIKDIVLDANNWNKKKAAFLDAELIKILGEIVQLPEPDNIDIAGTTLTWDPVPGAEEYEITWELVEPRVKTGNINSIITTNLEIDLVEVMRDKGAKAGNYLIKVLAIGKEGESLSSVAAEINFILEPEEFALEVESANNNYSYVYKDPDNDVWEVYHVQGTDSSSDLTWSVPSDWTTTQDLTSLVERTVFTYTDGETTIQVTYLPVGRLSVTVGENGSATLESWDKGILEVLNKSYLIDIENINQWYKFNTVPDEGYELDEIIISDDGSGYTKDEVSDKYTFIKSKLYTVDITFKNVIPEPVEPEAFNLDATSTNGNYVTLYNSPDNKTWEIYHVQGTSNNSSDLTLVVPENWTTTQDLDIMTNRTVFSYTNGTEIVQVTYLPVGRLRADISEDGNLDLISWDKGVIPFDRVYLIDIENAEQWYQFDVKVIPEGYEIDQINITGGSYTEDNGKFTFTESKEYSIDVTFKLVPEIWNVQTNGAFPATWTFTPGIDTIQDEPTLSITEDPVVFDTATGELKLNDNVWPVDGSYATLVRFVEITGKIGSNEVDADFDEVRMKINGELMSGKIIDGGEIDAHDDGFAFINDNNTMFKHLISFAHNDGANWTLMENRSQAEIEYIFLKDNTIVATANGGNLPEISIN